MIPNLIKQQMPPIENIKCSKYETRLTQYPQPVLGIGVRGFYRNAIGECYIIFLKPDVRQFPVQIVNCNRNEFIQFDKKLNYDHLIIFRLGSKPESLHICRNLLGNTQNHSPTKCKNTTFSGNRFLLDNSI